ncbi:MAG: DUF3710 domain-containing protein [Actinomycetia bacterium]|nr:DUF3710 domain-containing protein [Actinomycetes bacterium]
MALRRRERGTERSKLDATPPWGTREPDEPEPTTGPFDVRDAPDDELQRVDLGALRVPVWPGAEVRLAMGDGQQVLTATVVDRNGQMQLGVFAAPRSGGIWDDVRREIRESAGKQGALKDNPGGAFGTELVGRLPVDNRVTAVRFIGVDGPRWFVRAMLIGRAATERAAALPFERALRNLVVVRGNEPLPVRDPVPLRLPKEALPQAEDAEGADAETEDPAQRPESER